MSQDMMLFQANGALPAHIQGQNLGVTQALLATAGQGGNRIGLKNSRFRIVVNGKEERIVEEPYLDVIIVGVVPHISRIYYEGNYEQDSKQKPTCYSVDGAAPPIDLPTRQNDKCETCQWNQKGSKVVNGVKMKACGYFQRLVVMFPGDDTQTYYRLDVKAQGLFGDSLPNEQKFNIRDYGKFVGNRGVDVAALITRVCFDLEASVPKLLFKPFAFVTPQDFELVKSAVASDAVRDLLKIDTQTIDLSGETTSDEAAPAAAEQQATPAGAVPQQTTVAQQAQESVAAQPTQPATPPQPAAAEPAKKKYRPVPEKLGQFTVQQYLDNGWTKEQLIEGGYIEEVPEPAPQPPAAPAAPPKPAAPPAAPQPPKPASAPAAASTPVIESVPMPTQAPAKPAGPPAASTVQGAAAPVAETATDAELDSILEGLV